MVLVSDNKKEGGGIFPRKKTALQAPQKVDVLGRAWDREGSAIRCGKRGNMYPPYDVFFVDVELKWIGAATSTEQALKIIHTEGIKQTGKFVVLSQITGKKTFYRVSPHGATILEVSEPFKLPGTDQN